MIITDRLILDMFSFSFTLTYIVTFLLISSLLTGSVSADPSSYLPDGASLSAEELSKLRTSCDPLVQWLDSAEDEDEESEED